MSSPCSDAPAPLAAGTLRDRARADFEATLSRAIRLIEGHTAAADLDELVATIRPPDLRRRRARARRRRPKGRPLGANPPERPAES